MSETSQPDNTLPCRCKACSHSWNEPQSLPMEIGEWCNQVKRVCCPVCQSKMIKIVFGEGPPIVKLVEQAGGKS